MQCGACVRRSSNDFGACWKFFSTEGKQRKLNVNTKVSLCNFSTPRFLYRDLVLSHVNIIFTKYLRFVRFAKLLEKISRPIDVILLGYVSLISRTASVPNASIQNSRSRIFRARYRQASRDSRIDLRTFKI